MKLAHLFIAAVAACGPSNAAPETPEPAPAPAPEPTPSAEPQASAPKPKTEPAPAPKTASPDADGPDGVRRWASWDGPKQGAAITTKRAWAIAPNRLSANADKPSFAAVFPRVADVAKADAKEIVLEERWGQFAVPPALARPAEAPKGLKKGMIVRCPFGGNSVIARADATDATSTTCAFRFVDKARKEKVPTAEVMRLDGTLQMGAPVHARFESEPNVWYEAMALASEGDNVWVSLETQFAEGDPRAGKVAHKIKATDVRVVDASKALKRGDACVAPDFGRIEACTVNKVLEQGLAYEVLLEGKRTQEFELGRVAPKPKPTK